MPIISDVAKAAGVSITTVSRVMNGGRDFNPATIDIRLETVGARAVEQLLWRMAHPDDTDRVAIFASPVLVPGEAEGVDSTSNFQELEKASK